MKLEAGEGRLALKPANQLKTKLELPGNMALPDFPVFEVIDVGEGRRSPYSHEREEIPYRVGDSVIVGKFSPVQVDGTLFYVCDWQHVLAKVVE